METDEEIRKGLHRLNDGLRNLDHALDSCKFLIGTAEQRRSPEEVTAHLRQAFQDIDSTAKQQAVIRLLYQAMEFNRQCESLVAEIGGTWDIADERAARLNQIELARRWKSWGHSLGRWSLSVVIAILIYSTAVWAQQQWSFIKVPVHDWIIEANKAG